MTRGSRFAHKVNSSATLINSASSPSETAGTYTRIKHNIQDEVKIVPAEAYLKSSTTCRSVRVSIVIKNIG